MLLLEKKKKGEEDENRNTKSSSSSSHPPGLLLSGSSPGGKKSNMGTHMHEPGYPGVALHHYQHPLSLLLPSQMSPPQQEARKLLFAKDIFSHRRFPGKNGRINVTILHTLSNLSGLVVTKYLICGLFLLKWPKK